MEPKPYPNEETPIRHGGTSGGMTTGGEARDDGGDDGQLSGGNTQGGPMVGGETTGGIVDNGDSMVSGSGPITDYPQGGASGGSGNAADTRGETDRTARGGARMDPAAAGNATSGDTPDAAADDESV